MFQVELITASMREPLSRTQPPGEAGSRGDRLKLRAAQPAGRCPWSKPSSADHAGDFSGDRKSIVSLASKLTSRPLGQHASPGQVTGWAALLDN